ncbi:hypothetical protein [Alicyclobacillus contaminans]|uniref:hypothetical protein n=1 Tax=Alicyclobacillus contaminans TaxID=392016 RepID=UPI0003FA5DA6|nr:hypothetical protein [Alicyclobacillus contaminans]
MADGGNEERPNGQRKPMRGKRALIAFSWITSLATVIGFVGAWEWLQSASAATASASGGNASTATTSESQGTASAAAGSSNGGSDDVGGGTGDASDSWSGWSGGTGNPDGSYGGDEGFRVHRHGGVSLASGGSPDVQSGAS